MSDHRALIEQARAEHQPVSFNHHTSCIVCCGGERNARGWPCLTVRLAEALEERQAMLLDVIDRGAAQAIALAQRAERRVAELEQALQVQGGISAGIFRDLVGRESEVAEALARAETAERASNAWEANAQVYAQNAEAADRRAAELEAGSAAIRAAFLKAIKSKRRDLGFYCLFCAHDWPDHDSTCWAKAVLDPEAGASLLAEHAALEHRAESAERRAAELEKDWPSTCDGCSKSISVHGWFRAPDSSFRPHALCQGCMEKWMNAALESRAAQDRALAGLGGVDAEAQTK